MTAARRALLLAEDVVFTLVVPMSVTVWIPAGVFDLLKRAHGGAWGPMPSLAGVALACGLAIYLRCVWDFAARGRGIPAPIDHPTRLVVSGLYRYVRNPMYVGVLMFLAGEALFFESRDLLIYGLVFFAFVHAAVLVYEEPNLRRKFGPSYAHYSAAVSRWIPGRPYVE